MSLHHELEAERRIINAATDGPWIAFGDTIAHEVKTCTCAGNIPGYGHEQYCGLDGPLITSAAPPDAEFIALARTTLPLRNAQVEAVLKEVAETEEDIRAQQRKGGGNDYMDGLAEMCRDIRRAIEEAGA